ncbi:ABC transporter ATP-binding protein [Undibacterium sp. TS12]|uniref:ABC transporter ATP-binding protein n=1 Tax=Undibacterium sp. TS12 TaxID=2908202 RepID=UPI001F4CA2FF|nr:ABC transporter ATP-binding protein [Undibacterium sp. TS12]MCH8619985.1 ABC transporter ATP-binding protein [Undibacterium sp. TS12]
MLNKSYGLGTPAETQVLHDIQIDIGKGEFVALIGPSGSGKSTLLNIIGLLDRPSSGLLYLTGKETSTMNDAALTHLRGAAIGFVFQAHYLLSAFTATENVMIPMMMQKGHADINMRQRAEALLAQVDLEQWKNSMVGTMSGGQQQRVAIARALALNPPLILADEPTGNLDTKSTDAIFELMRRLNVENGTTFLMVTHNMDLARRCDRIIELVDGRVV